MKRRWQRPPSVPPRKGNVAGCGWWCAAPVSRGWNVRPIQDPQLWPDWRYHAFATNTKQPAVQADRLSPGPCPSRTGYTGHQTARRVVPLPVWELLRQRRLAFLRHPCSQPLPMDRTTHPPGRTTNQRQHRPHPTVHTARKDRKPRTKTDPAPSHPMAMGQHLVLEITRRGAQTARVADLVTAPVDTALQHRPHPTVHTARS